MAESTLTRADFTVIRSARRTLALEITREGAVLVRAPRRLPAREIDRFVAAHQSWIAEKQQAQLRRSLSRPEPDEAQQAALRQRARDELPARVARYAARMGVCPCGITVTGARTRFGSCSPKNRLCFSWRLMQYPDAAIDYVVVHELAHITHKNHGAAFYAAIASVLPDYQDRIRLLKG